MKKKSLYILIWILLAILLIATSVAYQFDKKRTLADSRSMAERRRARFERMEAEIKGKSDDHAEVARLMDELENETAEKIQASPLPAKAKVDLKEEGAGSRKEVLEAIELLGG